MEVGGHRRHRGARHQSLPASCFSSRRRSFSAIGTQSHCVIYEAIKISVENSPGSADGLKTGLIWTLVDAHDNIGPNGDLRRGILLIGLAAALYVLADLISPPTDSGYVN